VIAKLTEKQAAVLAFMREFEAENDNMPTIPAIARHFGYASSNAAQGHVHALERAGCIERIRGQIGYRFTRNTACASSADVATTR
jgi:SOS-response transcriptional repressor LexA